MLISPRRLSVLGMYNRCMSTCRWCVPWFVSIFLAWKSNFLILAWVQLMISTLFWIIGTAIHIITGILFLAFSCVPRIPLIFGNILFWFCLHNIFYYFISIITSLIESVIFHTSKSSSNKEQRYKKRKSFQSFLLIRTFRWKEDIEKHNLPILINSCKLQKPKLSSESQISFRVKYCNSRMHSLESKVCHRSRAVTTLGKSAGDTCLSRRY